MPNKYKPVIYAAGFAVGFIGSAIIRKYFNESKCSKSSKNGHIDRNSKIRSTIAKLYDKIDELNAELDELSTKLNESNAENDSCGCCDLDKADNSTNDGEIDFERKR